MKNKMQLNYLSTLILCIIFRMCCLISKHSAHYPDEYWQSLEVAHRIVFGYGYLTWEWVYAIRSYLYVCWIAALYYILKIFGIDSAWSVIWLPKIVQGIFTAISDTYFIAWVHKISTKRQAYWSSWFYMTNIFLAYMATRTFSNTIETNFTCIVLYYYPWFKRERGNTNYVWWVCFASVIRPTSAVIWTPLCIYHLFEYRNEFKYLLTKFIRIGLIVLTISTSVDCYLSGKFVLTWWNFFKYNIIHNISSMYSVSSVDWYVTEALPTVLGPSIVPFYIAVIFKLLNIMPKNPVFNKIAVTFTITLAVYSIIPHKECRFILPLVPMAAYISSFPIYLWTSPKSKIRTRLLIIIKLTGLVSAYVFYFICFNRNVSPTQFMDYVRSPNNSILILVGCHATPFYSYLHLNIPARFLRCDPDIEGNSNGVRDCAEFFNNPIQWLDKEYPEKDYEKHPTHVICFSSDTPRIDQFLKSRNYEKIVEINNGVSRPWEQSNFYLQIHKKTTT